MKAWCRALCVTAVLLGGSLVRAQQGSSPLIQSAKIRPAKHKTVVDGELDKVPEKARAKPNPLESDPEAVSAGRNLFERHCAECHGTAAEGGPRGPTLRAREVQDAPPGAIFWVLTNGIVWHGMPVWSKLPEPQRWQLVCFIKSLGVKPANTRDRASRPTM
jgi:mono/diheme cytochrome c family protein